MKPSQERVRWEAFDAAGYRVQGVWAVLLGVVMYAAVLAGVVVILGARV